MAKARFGEGLKPLAILPAQDITNTNTWTSFLDLDLANWVTYVIQFGSCSSAGAGCDDCLIQVACSSAGTTANLDMIDFSYRLGAAAGTDSLGAITTGTSDGVTVGPALDNKVMIIDVDPSVVAAKGANERWLCLEFTPASTATNVAVVALIEHEQPGNSMAAST